MNNEAESRNIMDDLRAFNAAHAASAEKRLDVTEETPALIARIMAAIPGGSWRV